MSQDQGRGDPLVAGDIDTVLGFTMPERHARGRIVRLGPALETILAAHAYPPAVERLLADALTLTALLGATLKEAGGQLTLQAQAAGGIVDLLVCDYRNGEMRGYVRHDPERLAELAADPSLGDLFGEGYLAITFDLATSGERYQGIVPLEGNSIAEAAERFFAQSEQIPSLVRLAQRETVAGRIAGGLLLQHLPEGEEGRERIHVRLNHPEWEHVHALAGTIADAELTDPSLTLDRIAWRLFNEEEVRVFPATQISRGCRCEPDHIRSVLARFPEDERADMADDAGRIHVDCEFCVRRFTISLEELAAHAP